MACIGESKNVSLFARCVGLACALASNWVLFLGCGFEASVLVWNLRISGEPDLEELVLTRIPRGSVWAGPGLKETAS